MTEQVGVICAEQTKHDLDIEYIRSFNVVPGCWKGYNFELYVAYFQQWPQIDLPCSLMLKLYHEAMAH